MKVKNIWAAYKSTVIGLVQVAVTALYQGLSNPPVNWKAIGTSVGLALLLAVTDLLKENSKK
jgi:hypothetical protein